jgi:hypothetical protein
MNKEITALVLFFSTILMGCGGGGGGGASQTDSGGPVLPPYEKTISTFATSAYALIEPKLMVVSGAGLLTVVDKSFGGSVVTFNTTDGSVHGTRLAVSNASGVAVQPVTSTIYYTGDGVNNQTVLANGNPAGIPDTGGNLYGLVFTSQQDLYVANISGSGSILVYSNFNPAATPSVSSLGGFPSSLVANGNLIYISMSGNDASILELDPSHINDVPHHGVRTLPWGTFKFPNGIAIDGGYAYVVNAGSASGDGGFISKVKLSDGSKEVFASDSVGVWSTQTPGFCNPAGIAIYEKYVYVSNGVCSSTYSGYSNRNKILKIKLP